MGLRFLEYVGLATLDYSRLLEAKLTGTGKQLVFCFLRCGGYATLR